MTRRLSDLFNRPFASDPVIAGVTADSRKVTTGWLFAALPGTKVDGRDFFADEYFSRIKKPIHYDLAEAEESDASNEYLDEVFARIFNVDSSTSSDDEG